MGNYKIPLDSPLTGRKEIDNLAEAVSSGWLSWQGRYVREFEEGFADYCGVKAGVAVQNGTTAILLSLRALGVGEGDEVIVPSLTFSAPVFAISLVGATPVFVDTRPANLTADPTSIATKISDRTKAILVVHLYGRPALMDAIMQIAEEHGLKVIEDCAEAPGGLLHGRSVGSFGDVACFSFHNKLIATGEGGMVITDNGEIADEIRALINPDPHNRGNDRRLIVNQRMSNLQAAVGVAQLERLEEVVEMKRRVAQRYDEAFSRTAGVQTIPEDPDTRAVYWRYSLIVDRSRGVSRDQLVEKLAAQGIEGRAIFLPMHLHAAYKNGPAVNLPNAEMMSDQVIDLPTSPLLTEEELDTVIGALTQAIGD